MQRPPHSALKQYANVGLETGVTAADPHGLILLLFDGALEALARGKRHMERGETAAKCDALAMATNIIAEGLKASLDVKVGGELARNLSDLYDYMTSRLLLANRNNHPEILMEVAELLRQLSDSWRQIGKPRPQATGRTPVQPAPATYKPSPASAHAGAAQKPAPAGAAAQTAGASAGAAHSAAVQTQRQRAVEPPAAATTPVLVAPMATQPTAAQLQQRRVAAAYGSV
jgi:flagellar protein FliS